MAQSPAAGPDKTASGSPSGRVTATADVHTIDPADYVGLDADEATNKLHALGYDDVKRTTRQGSADGKTGTVASLAPTGQVSVDEPITLDRLGRAGEVRTDGTAATTKGPATGDDEGHGNEGRRQRGPRQGKEQVTTPHRVGGRYELGELLGRGGMAEVRKGTDVRLGRTVAIKRLRTDLASDPTFQARFRREAQSAASLNHPSIVSVYDTGEEMSSDGTQRRPALHRDGVRRRAHAARHHPRGPQDPARAGPRDHLRRARRPSTTATGPGSSTATSSPAT